MTKTGIPVTALAAGNQGKQNVLIYFGLEVFWLFKLSFTVRLRALDRVTFLFPNHEMLA